MTTNTFPVSSQIYRQGDIKVFSGFESNVNNSGGAIDAFTRSNEMTSWSDAQLISAILNDPPDEAAMDVLISRYWDTVFARCQMLTQHREKALDLAQSTWCRLLRARHTLKPDGNFPAYLNTITKNLFRDSYRAARRAGPMADYRLESLDAAHSNEDGETTVLMDLLPDLKSLQMEEQTLLVIDIDQALQNLPAHLREVLVARYLDGESCAEIGFRHGRTEQTVSGWVREALRQMKTCLEEPRSALDCGEKESHPKSLAAPLRFQL